MSAPEGLWKTLVVVLVMIGAIVGALALLALTPAPTESWTVVRGAGSASDGRIAISVGASRLASVPVYGGGTRDVFLLVNLTFVNVGPGNTSVNAGWFVGVTWNGTEYTNTWFQVTGAEAAGELPIPYVLASSQHVSGWLAFFIAPLPDASAKTLAALQIEKVAYYETSYGGRYVGNGGWSGAIEQLRVRFEITPV